MSELYEKVSSAMHAVEREKKILDFWRRERIFERSMEERAGCPTYTFYDGPPTANGKPHIGHVLTRVIKDMIPRYRTMKGHMVPRKAGWDTHGLPVEIEVEKILGLDGKEQIEQYGLEPFICQCKESVWKYKGMWEDFSGTVGFWADMDHPYVTYDNDFIESEWWALRQIWDKGLLYRGYKIVPYCPRCGTPLSAQEVAHYEIYLPDGLSRLAIRDTNRNARGRSTRQRENHYGLPFRLRTVLCHHGGRPSAAPERLWSERGHRPGLYL